MSTKAPDAWVQMPKDEYDKLKAELSRQRTALRRISNLGAGGISASDTQTFVRIAHEAVRIASDAVR